MPNLICSAPQEIDNPASQVRIALLSVIRSTARQGVEMVVSTEFANFLRDQLPSLGDVAMRRMFGKTGVCCEGVMFGMVTENALYFRVDSQNRATLKEAESFPTLNYVKGGQTIDLSFWRAPDRLFDEPEELIAWARAALAAAHRLAAKRGHAPVRASRGRSYADDA